MLFCAASAGLLATSGLPTSAHPKFETWQAAWNETRWRRIVFSIAVHNTDDHLRNYGFLLSPEGWCISPAYDLNPDPDPFQVDGNDAFVLSYEIKNTRNHQKVFTSLDHGADSWKAPPAPGQEVTMNPQRYSEVAQKSASNVELQKRSQALDNVYQQNQVKSGNLGELTIALPNDAPPRPVWIRDQLFLLKPVSSPVRA